MTWIKDAFGSAIINLNHIRSIEIRDHDVVAVYGEMTEEDKENDEGALYERFILFEGQEEEDTIHFLSSISKKLKAID